METKTFSDKKIRIRKITPNDVWKAEKFQEFIDSLVDEDAMVSQNKRTSIKEEKAFIEKTLKKVRNKEKIFFLAECENKIVGTTSIELEIGRRSHVCKFGIMIKQGYRGIGLGGYLMAEIIKLVKKELEPQPKMIDLRVYSVNKPAIALYKKMGFKIVAKIPKRVQYKDKLVDEIVMIKHV